MIYVSAMSRSGAVSWMFRLILVAIVAVPVLILMITLISLQEVQLPGEDAEMAAARNQILLLTGLTAAISLATVVLLLYIMRRRFSTRVEISSWGIHHLQPGKERRFAWSDIEKIRKPLFKNQRTPPSLIIKDGKPYVVDLFLTPESPMGEELVFGFPGAYWKSAGGRKERLTFENCAVMRELTQRRPDLL